MSGNAHLVIWIACAVFYGWRTRQLILASTQKQKATEE